MSQETQDQQEQYILWRHERIADAEVANLIDYYTPLRPATVSPKAEAVTAQLTQETKLCNAAIQSAN